MKPMKKLGREKMRKIRGGDGFAPFHFSLQAPPNVGVGGPRDLRGPAVYY